MRRMLEDHLTHLHIRLGCRTRLTNRFAKRVSASIVQQLSSSSTSYERLYKLHLVDCLVHGSPDMLELT